VARVILVSISGGPPNPTVSGYATFWPHKRFSYMAADSDALEEALRGFPPPPNQVYLENQPKPSLFCKPKIMPLKSPNLQMIERLEAEANTKEVAPAGVPGGGRK